MKGPSSHRAKRAVVKAILAAWERNPTTADMRLGDLILSALMHSPNPFGNRLCSIEDYDLVGYLHRFASSHDTTQPDHQAPLPQWGSGRDCAAGPVPNPWSGLVYHFTETATPPAGGDWVLLGATVAEGAGSYFWVKPA